MYTDPTDIAFASKQTVYAKLDEEERILQDNWAKAKATQLAPCPAGLQWERHLTCPGFRCTGGMHYMSDLIIASGVPSMYTRRCPPDMQMGYMPNYAEGIVPKGYFGPVAPIGIDPHKRQPCYPFWT
ncbi:uncharacterized protein BCR38DRAFT_18961 [Pseudomassariella vexata]|uniref:Uncharacterized protein n=1 Tax=Pseudomassariella vexata TaxID=1141098 RepID=A0A1Y2EKB9_9PEZI|nr:uncharacterized protein BCR38DRAFT_18961 [Pseudomassariella vexata]ORY71734.1 hypothetical protein BCR38DRAFT_18961 [Pseudomassariella vexata]